MPLGANPKDTEVGAPLRGVAGLHDKGKEESPLAVWGQGAREGREYGSLPRSRGGQPHSLYPHTWHFMHPSS